MTNSSDDLRLATTQTAKQLKTIAQSPPVRELSRLSLPEINAVVELVSQIVPAGNIPGMILSGLTRLPGQRLPAETVQQHIGALFNGVEHLFDQVAFGTVFAGPAAIIWGYQHLLKLAGKDTESSFPEGIWQFYVEYALREDTARHVNETHGFNTILRQHRISLSQVDRLTAGVMAAISCIHQYDALLEIEWRERISTALLEELTHALPDAGHYANLYRQWEIQRPYRRGAEAASYDYPDYRRIKFEHFLQSFLQEAPAEVRVAWAGRMQAAEQELPAYLRQMSILAYLQPGEYGETRVPYSFERAQVGLVLRGNYYLLPVYTPGSDQPLDVDTVRAQMAALLALPEGAPTHLTELATVRRSAMHGLRPKLNVALQEELDRLRFAPILINADIRSADSPLVEIRQAERGIGDHALTVFHTERTLVFDQSHIFFDGVLGAALAEILTNEALSWAGYLNTLPEARPAVEALYSRLAFPIFPEDLQLIRHAPHVSPEAAAESEGVDLKACKGLRKLFKQRSDKLHLTVNDLLVVYRAIHAVRYKPSPSLDAELQELAAEKSTHALAVEILRALEESRRVNPSLLIPMDASRRSPRDRLYPLSMEVPLVELDLLNLHQRSIDSLNRYEATGSQRDVHYQEFDQAQHTYLATLAGLGTILDRLKEMAISGESASTGAIKLLAHMPPALQHLMDKVPQRFELLNNLLKGREVFSNVGAVVPTSTLRRFVTAKDDNDQKQLVWGIITDTGNVLRISLRDFRPHVAGLRAIGRTDLANRITQDYLDAYVAGFNHYINELQHITLASRETQIQHPNRHIHDQ